LTKVVAYDHWIERVVGGVLHRRPTRRDGLA
jgi:hypothetical protein